MLTSTIIFAQTGIIKGTIKTSDGYPAESVTLSLKGTGKIAISDKLGHYEIRRIQPGSYTLHASFAGLKSQELKIEVKPGETNIPDITLSENAQQLLEVIVTANKLKKESPFVAKLPLKYLENPQVYSVVSNETLKQQGNVNYDDALKNVPGISRTWESTGRAYGDGASYFALRGLEVQPTMYNGLPGLTSGYLDPADIERIEVIKGPTGTLFGASLIAYGGIINTVTKRPYFDRFGGEISYSAGSFGLNRLTADINAPLSETKKVALRLNTALHSEGSFQDAGFMKSLFVAPSFAYEVNERLSFQFMTQILQQQRAAAPIFFHSNREEPMQYKTIEELNLNNKLSFTSNDLTIKNPRFNMQGQMIYKLSDKWTSQTVFSTGEAKSDGYYSYIWPDVEGTNNFGHYISNQQGTMSTTDVQQNFTGDFSIGSMRNRIVVGLDAFTRNNVDNSSGYGFIRNVTPQGDENFADPFSPGDTLPPVYLTRASIDQLLANSGGTNSNVKNSAYSIYVSDVINLTPSLLAMVSARIDYFDSKGEKSNPDDDYHQTAVSPKFGVLYQPILDKISIFGNYMNGFVNVEPMQVADPDGSNPRVKSFRPEQANQWEFGVKTNLFANKLNATVSYYNITVSDRVTGDPDNFYNYLQGGKMRSKGFEIDLEANPYKGFNFIAGFAHNHSEVLVGDGDFYSTPGRTAGGQGPNDLINFWGTYRITEGALKNFGIGFGGNHASQYKVIDNEVTGDFYLPSYTVLNGGIFYNSDDFRVSVNMNNIGNKDYYIGYWSVNPQKPRNFVASVSFKF
ncbi:MAG: TonB-dependent receptor [Chitinophagaceae bacterium]|nr:TonB-dependent receptor [Chitinophagaceae bacterium]